MASNTFDINLIVVKNYLYEVVCTIFSADFWIFHNFWPQFLENCSAT